MGYDVIWVSMCNYKHIWHSYLEIWLKIRKKVKKCDFYAKIICKLYIKFRYHDIYDNVEWYKNDLEIMFCYKRFYLILYFKNYFSDRNFCPPSVLIIIWFWMFKSKFWKFWCNFKFLLKYKCGEDGRNFCRKIYF